MQIYTMAGRHQQALSLLAEDALATHTEVVLALVNVRAALACSRVSHT